MNDKRPDVSVIICVRNGERTLLRQLEALEAQQGDTRFEVVVVDNGSTDGTAELVRRWIAEPSHSHCAARLIDGGTEPGIPRARNLGASEARGRVIAFCDADDVVEPNWVAAFGAAVEDGQLAGGRILAYGEDGTPRPGVFGDGLIATPYLPHVGNCNCAIDRGTFFAVGGYDESLPPYGFEDVDLSWRVQEAGYPLIYVPQARVRFTVSGNRASLRKRFLLGKGRVLMAARFPRYDSTQYTVRSTLSGMVADVRRLVAVGTKDRAAAKRAASSLVASAGRFAAVCEYRRTGFPAPRLLRTEATDDTASDGPRIAIATNNGDIGGGEVMLLNIAGALRELGCAVTVIGRPPPQAWCPRPAGAASTPLPWQAPGGSPTWLLSRGGGSPIRPSRCGATAWFPHSPPRGSGRGSCTCIAFPPAFTGQPPASLEPVPAGRSCRPGSSRDTCQGPPSCTTGPMTSLPAGR